MSNGCLAYDPQGRPAVVYSDEGLLKLARRDAAGNWSVEPLPEQGNLARLTFDDNGEVYISAVEEGKVKLLGTALTPLQPGDFNGDDLLTAEDIELLFDEYGQRNYSFDLQADGEINTWDTDVLVQSLLGTQYGDADLDRDVDATDLATLGMNWEPGGEDRTWSQGDFDGDGDVDATDLAKLGMNWHPDYFPAVPEPTSLVLLGLGGAMGLLKTRRSAG
jgi:hypothetical protein